MPEHSVEESKGLFLEQFEKASQEDRWFAIVCTPEGPRQYLIRKVTKDFSPIECLDSLLALKNLIDEEVGKLFAPQKPLPLAPHLKVKDTDGEFSANDVLKTFESMPSFSELEDKVEEEKNTEPEIYPSHPKEEKNKDENSD